VLALTAGFSGYWFIWRTPSAAGETITQTATAALQTLDKSVTASGTITQAVNESVAFAAKGTVLTVDVAEGDLVEEGQVLATIDTLQLNADLLDAKATLAQAERTLASAEAAADGSDASDATIAAAQARVEIAQVAADEAEGNLSNAVLTAPAAGQITSVAVAVGDSVGSSTSGSTGSMAGTGSAGGAMPTSSNTSSSGAAFTIVGTQDWSISLTVADSDLALLSVGGQAEITLDGVADTLFGTITSLGKVASTSGGSASFPVEVQITGTAEGLYDGLSAEVALIYERRLDVLTIPISAVVTEDGVSYVDKLVDGVATRTEVTLGETVGSVVEITAGLAEGDEVQITVTVSQTGSGTEQGTQGEFTFELPGGQGGQGGQFQMPEGGGFGGEFGGGAPGGGQFPGAPGGSNG
jgi:macrolide-specific efflux system membrane fusion protein